MIQVIEVPHRLDQRKTVLLAADRTAVERGKAFRGGPGRGKEIGQPVERTVVVLDQLADPRRQAGIGQLVPRQHQVAIVGKRPEPFAAFQPVAHRVGLGLGGIDPEVGADRGEQLVAADHQRAVPAPQGRMFRRMAVADPHVPVAPAEPDPAALLDPAKPERHVGDDIDEIERTLRPTLFVDRLVHPRRPPIGQGLVHRHHVLVKLQHPGKQPGGPGGHQLGAVVALKPAGEANVVGVVVGDDHPSHRPAGERAREQLLPDLPAAPAVDPGVDDGPAALRAVVVGESVDVDMVERHRQRQPHPQHALGHLDRLPLCRRLRPGEPDRRRHRIGRLRAHCLAHRLSHWIAHRTRSSGAMA